MSVNEAKAQADKVFSQIEQSKSVDAEMLAGANAAEDETLSSPWMVAISSFLCFGAGALLPVLPFFVDLPQMVAGDDSHSAGGHWACPAPCCWMRA